MERGREGWVEEKWKGGVDRELREGRDGLRRRGKEGLTWSNGEGRGGDGKVPTLALAALLCAQSPARRDSSDTVAPGRRAVWASPAKRWQDGIPSCLAVYENPGGNLKGSCVCVCQCGFANVGVLLLPVLQ